MKVIQNTCICIVTRKNWIRMVGENQIMDTYTNVNIAIIVNH